MLRNPSAFRSRDSVPPALLTLSCKGELARTTSELIIQQYGQSLSWRGAQRYPGPLWGLTCEPALFLGAPLHIYCSPDGSFRPRCHTRKIYQLSAYFSANGTLAPLRVVDKPEKSRFIRVIDYLFPESFSSDMQASQSIVFVCLSLDAAIHLSP